jgi:hypothetical protein
VNPPLGVGEPGENLGLNFLAKPMNERTHFLRRRLPGGGSAL